MHVIVLCSQCILPVCIGYTLLIFIICFRYLYLPKNISFRYLSKKKQKKKTKKQNKEMTVKGRYWSPNPTLCLMWTLWRNSCTFIWVEVSVVEQKSVILGSMFEWFYNRWISWCMVNCRLCKASLSFQL